MKKILFVTLVLVLGLVLAAPAGATPPEELTFELDSLYSFLDFGNPTGAWTSSGMVTSSGELARIEKHFGAGWPPGKGFQTTHMIEVLSDANGSIAISTQASGFEWEYTENALCAALGLPFESDQHFSGSGRWVILYGTGAYANLRGEGTAVLSGDVDCLSLTMSTEGIYTGQGHFDP